MSKRLQENDGRIGETVTPIRPIELIVNAQYLDRLMEHIRNAKSHVLICAYAWRWYANEPDIDIQRFNILILQLIKKGVQVRVLVNDYQTFSMLRVQNIHAKYVDVRDTLHTKAVMIDHKQLYIGSHNLTKRGTLFNYEITVLTTLTEPILQFEDYFNHIWSVANES